MLQANLDKGAVLVPGEYLDMMLAVQRRRRIVRTAAMGSVLAIVPGPSRQFVSAAITQPGLSRTRHVAIRFVLGRLGVWHNCETSVHVI